MKGLKASQFTFVFWILLTLFFILYVVFISLNNMTFSKLIYIFILVMIILGFLGTIMRLMWHARSNVFFRWRPLHCG